MEEKKRLILIAEGAAHTVEYFHKNKVYPGAVVFEATKFTEMAPYLTKNDEVLVVIKGLTDFNLAEIYSLINELEKVEEKIHDITIMSNMDLGKIPTPYHRYSGDLFYGEVLQVINSKFYAVEDSNKTEDENSKKGKKNKKSKTTAQAEYTPKLKPVNGVMTHFKSYNDSSVQFKVYGSTKRVIEPTHSLDNVINKLVEVDLFKK